MNPSDRAPYGKTLVACVALIVVNASAYGWWWGSTQQSNASALPLLFAMGIVPLTASCGWLAARSSLRRISPRGVRALPLAALSMGAMVTLLALGASLVVGMTPDCEWCALALLLGVPASPVLGLHATAWTGLLGVTAVVAVETCSCAEDLPSL